MNRFFLTIAAATIAASALPAQTPALTVDALVADLKQSYNGVKTNILDAANQMPEENYNFEPGPGSRPFGQWVAHVADSQAGSCGGVTGNAKRLNAGKMTSKADLIAALKESFEICDAAYNGTTAGNYLDPVMSFRGPTPRAAALYGNMAHDQECYGSMAVYLRAKDMVPPSTQRMMQGRGKKKQ